MNFQTIHIVSFSVPFPADYGGAIDVFHKIKAFQKAGVDVILHCFQYDRPQANELLEYCKEVHYYKRNMNPFFLLSSEPFIVCSRKNTSLIKRLEQDTHPILLEGLHSCAVLKSIRPTNRQIIIRSHNIEHDYYKHLATVEKKALKRAYFTWESAKLKKYESVVFPLASEILGISAKDTVYLNKQYQKGIEVSAFHQFDSVRESVNKVKKGFAFYHGNLSIGENNEAALYLVQQVFTKTNYPLIIAGSKPSKELIEACQKQSHVTLLSDISSNDIMQYLQDAQINVLPTFQSTGIKLKLLAALFSGKHCLVNLPMVEGTGLEHLCVVKISSAEFAHSIDKLAETEYDPVQIQIRKEVLKPFSNDVGIQKILESIK